MTDQLRAALAEALDIEARTLGPAGERIERTTWAANILAHPAVQAALRPLLDVVEAARDVDAFWRSLPNCKNGPQVRDTLRTALDRHLQGGDDD